MTHPSTSNTLVPLRLEYRQHSPKNRCPWCTALLRLYVETRSHALRVVQCTRCDFISIPPTTKPKSKDPSP